MNKDELIDKLLENSNLLNQYLERENEQKSFDKLEKFLQEKENEKKLDNDIKKIIDDMLF